MAALYLLLAITLFFAFRGILGHNRLFELPTAVAMLIIMFFVPQMLATERSSVLQTFDPWILWLYMSICLIAIFLGFEWGKRIATKQAAKKENIPISQNRIVMGALVLAVIGLLASYRVTTLSSNLDGTSSWTGEITLWYLIVQAMFFAFCLAFISYLKGYRSKLLLLVAIITLVSLSFGVFTNVKRHMIAEIAIIILGGWFFIKGKQPPKALVFVGCFLGAVLLQQVGTVRNYVSSNQGNVIEAIIDGVPFQQFNYFESDDAPEISQALVDIYAVNQTGNFEGPTLLWNKMVHQYVPAFIVGQQVKDSLKIASDQAVEDNYRLDQMDREGATHTGFSDTYKSYWIFGCLVFFVIGGFMGWLYGFALQDRLWAQFYYLILLNDGMIAITESTDRFFASLPIVFVLTFLFVRPVGFGRKQFKRHTRGLPSAREMQIRRRGQRSTALR